MPYSTELLLKVEAIMEERPFSVRRGRCGRIVAERPRKSHEKKSHFVRMLGKTLVFLWISQDLSSSLGMRFC